eukprot:1639746-Amphidinium_carterae.1
MRALGKRPWADLRRKYPKTQVVNKAEKIAFRCNKYDAHEQAPGTLGVREAIRAKENDGERERERDRDTPWSCGSMNQCRLVNVTKLDSAVASGVAWWAPANSTCPKCTAIE